MSRPTTMSEKENIKETSAASEKGASATAAAVKDGEGKENDEKVQASTEEKKSGEGQKTEKEQAQAPQQPPPPIVGFTKPPRPEEPDQVVTVSTADLTAGIRMLASFGRLIIVGPPGSGKSNLGQALLKVFTERGYRPKTSVEMCGVCHMTLTNGVGPRICCLVDGQMGDLRISKRTFTECQNFLHNSQQIWEREGKKEFNCLLIVTMHPHIFKDLRAVEHDPYVSLAHPKVTLTLTQNPINPAEPFVPDVGKYVPVLWRMLREPDHGLAVSALFGMTMMGYSHFLHHPAPIQDILKDIGFREISPYKLEEYRDLLKGFLFLEEETGFTCRAVYEAAGLALARSYALSLLMRVCDLKFFNDYVRFDEDAKSSFTSVAIEKGSYQIQLALQRVRKELSEGTLAALCQHPSLAHLHVVESLTAHCAEEKNVTEKLMSVNDKALGLPLVYWSVWSRAVHLHNWCLDFLVSQLTGVSTREEPPAPAAAKGREAAVSGKGRGAKNAASSKGKQQQQPTVTPSVKGKELPKDLLVSLLASVLFAEAGDTLLVAIGNLAKQILAEMTFKHPEHGHGDGGMLRLTLPKPKVREGEVKARLERVKARLSSTLRYLQSDELPFPEDMLKITFDEDSMLLEFPADQWYLLIRMLTDREKDEVDVHGDTVQHLAAKAGNLEAIRIIVKGGGSVTIKNQKGLTPPQIGAARQQRRPAPAAEEGEELGRGGAAPVHQKGIFRAKHSKDNPHGGDSAGPTSTPPTTTGDSAGTAQGVSTSLNEVEELHTACQKGDMENVKVLLCHGVATVQSRFSEGKTPLHSAVLAEDRQYDLITLLLELQADPNVQDDSGCTPLHQAVADDQWDTMRLLVQHRADVNVANNDRSTPLHVACALGHTKMAALFLQNGANVNSKDAEDCTPLHLASSTSPDAHAADLVSLLLQQPRVDVSPSDSSGATPLHAACERGREDVVGHLLRVGARLDTKDCRGRTPGDVAKDCGREGPVFLQILRGGVGDN